jgi:hypothetical protein
MQGMTDSLSSYEYHYYMKLHAYATVGARRVPRAAGRRGADRLGATSSPKCLNML